LLPRRTAKVDGRTWSAAGEHAEPVLNVPPDEARWLVWGRSVFAVAVVVALIALGVANVAMYSRWHEVEDGVFWGRGLKA